MKRWMMLCLAAAMILCLMACGGTDASGDQDVQAPMGQESENQATDVAQTDPATERENTEDVEGADLTVAASIQLAVNPQLQVDLTGAGTVVRVEPLNADAQGICASTNVVGKPCEEALAILVGEMVAQKYLTDGKEIAITVVVTEQAAAKMDQWVDRAVSGVTQALAEHQINAKMSMDAQVDNRISGEEMVEGEVVPPIPEEMPPAEDPSSPPARHPAQETDHVGNTIIWNEDGSIVVLDPQGNLIETRWDEPDGTRVEKKDPEGHPQTLKHDSQGRILWMRVDLGAGYWIETTYYTNGKEKSVIIHDNGYYAERHYYESGSPKSEVSESGDHRMEVHFYANGNKSWELAQNEDRSEESRWTEDGKYIEQIKKTSDVIWQAEYYDSGALRREYTEYDGGVSEVLWYENGARMEEKGQDGDGGWHRVYNADGTSYEYFYAPDGTVWYSEFDAAGNQLLETHKQVQ